MRYRDPKKESDLQKYYGLSDEETEFQIMDRFSFLQFLGLQAGDDVPLQMPLTKCPCLLNGPSTCHETLAPEYIQASL